MASSVAGTAELRAAIVVMKHAGPEVRKALRKEAATWAPVLGRAIMSRASGDVDRRIAATTKTTVTAKGLRATIGTTGKLRGGGVKLGVMTRPHEFGTTRQNVKLPFEGTSPRGRHYQGKRRILKQIPRANPKGRFIYQGLADSTPELVTRYVRAVVRVIDRA